MSRENVEIVKRLFHAFNRADWTTAFTLYHPDVTWEAWSDLPDGGIYHGHDGVRQFNRQWLSAFQHVIAEIEDPVEVDDHVVLTLRQTGTGKDSGARVEATVGMIFTVHGGRIVRVRTFDERARALEAVGLSE